MSLRNVISNRGNRSVAMMRKLRNFVSGITTMGIVSLIIDEDHTKDIIFVTDLPCGYHCKCTQHVPRGRRRWGSCSLRQIAAEGILGAGYLQQRSCCGHRLLHQSSEQSIKEKTHNFKIPVDEEYVQPHSPRSHPRGRLHAKEID